MRSRWLCCATILPLMIVSAGCEGHGELARRAEAGGLRPLSDWRAYAGPAPEVVRAADSVVRSSGDDPRRYFFSGVGIDSLGARAHLNVLYETDFAKRNAHIVGNPSERDFQLLYSLTEHRVLQVGLGQ